MSQADQTSFGALTPGVLEAFYSEDTQASFLSPAIFNEEARVLVGLYGQSQAIRIRVAIAAGGILQCVRGLGIDLQPSQVVALLSEMEIPILTLFSEGLRAGWFGRGAVDGAAILDHLYEKSENGPEI